MKRKKIFLYIKRVRIVSFFCRKLFSDSSSLRGAQRRSNPEGRGFLDCFVATLLTMTLFASDMLRDLRLTPKVLNMKLQFGVANNPEQAAGAARGTVSPSLELRSSSTPSELSRGRCYPRTALRLFGVIHIEVLRTSCRRHYAFSCGTKRLFTMTTRLGLLRRISNSQNYTARGIILMITAVLMSCTPSRFSVKLRITGGIADEKIKSAVETGSSQLLSETGRAFSERRRPDFTGIAVSPEAARTVLDIWDSAGMMYCNVPKLDMTCTKRCGGGYQVRDIPVIMPGIAPADTLRKLVINYAGDGTVNEIYLSAGSVSAILTEQPDDRETCRRQKIADLIERYYTAYTVKDLDFMRMVFNPGILITKKMEDLPVKTDYRTISAEDYLRKLKHVFAANRHVIPEFKETEIRRHPQFSELYGVIIKHSWDTSTYKEAGYVFLVTDFANEDEPIVRNCTWQSESHEKMSNDEIFNLYMFNNITE